MPSWRRAKQSSPGLGSRTFGRPRWFNNNGAMRAQRNSILPKTASGSAFRLSCELVDIAYTSAEQHLKLSTLPKQRLTLPRAVFGM
eukprot:11443626-Alexandrium_andersonii.AAC.1